MSPPMDLTNPVHEFQSMVGNTPGGLKAIAFDFDDATRFDATLTGRGVPSVEPRGFGSRQQNLAQRNPGQGIFAKAHEVLGLTGYFHVAIWVAIARTDPRAAPGSVFINEDEFSNKYFTIGGAPTGLLPCTGNLKSDLSRGADVSPNPRLFKVRLAYRSGNEAQLIDALLSKDAAYGDNLPYACFPDNNPDYYNSNSFAAGLLSVTGLPRPSEPNAYANKFPGWWKPLPASAFGQ